MSDHFSVWEAALLGLVQGATEWLPVSSSGHLVIARELFGVDSAPLMFDLLVHVATLVVVVTYYRRSIWDILVALWRIPGVRRAGGSWRAVLWEDQDRRLAWLVVVGSVPVGLAGFFLESFFVGLFESLLAVGVALLLTGVWLWGTRYVPARRPSGDLSLRDAVLVGLAQATAIAPGVSRSGMTVAAATYLGLDRAEAVRYSFLLSIPAILGATVFQARDGALLAMGGEWVPFVVGMVVAAVVGYGTLALLVRMVQQGRLHWWAGYCWVVGGGIVLMSGGP